MHNPLLFVLVSSTTMTSATGSADLALVGGRVIDPASGLDALATVVIRGGHIDQVVPHSAHVPPDVLTIEVYGQIVTPGFIDLHSHLRFPGFPDKETVETGTHAAVAGGFTTVCAMANTDPVVDTDAVLRQVVVEAERSAVAHVRQLGAVTIGLLGTQLADLDRLAESGAVAFSDDGMPISDTHIMRCALEASARLQRPISVHEEDAKVVRGGVANAGEIARRLGLREWPCAGEASLIARDLSLLAEGGGHLHIAHVSCKESVALLRVARAQGLHVTAEVTPHHLSLTDEVLAGDADLNLCPAHPCTKVNPPLRSQEDVDSLIGALADGTIDAVATDHAPHTTSDKSAPFQSAAFGFSGLETALPLLLSLVDRGHLTLPTVIDRLACGPARVFGLPGGNLRPGSVADVCVFDPGKSWLVTPDTLHSRGKNTPLIGSTLAGQVTLTLVAGRAAHSLLPQVCNE